MAHRDILAPPAPTPTLNSHTSKDWLLNQPSAQPPLTPVVAVFKKRQQRSRIFPWRWEVFALFVSLICLGLICFVGLWAANTIFPDSPFTEFHGIQWSVNSIVALLSTLQRSTMLYVLGEGEYFINNLCQSLTNVLEVIGHLKWAWFDRSSSLIQLERFDNASRGVWGSLRFFFTRRLLVSCWLSKNGGSRG